MWYAYVGLCRGGMCGLVKYVHVVTCYMYVCLIWILGVGCAWVGYVCIVGSMVCICWLTCFGMFGLVAYV